MDKIFVQTVCNDKFANRLNLIYLNMKQMIFNSDALRMKHGLYFESNYWLLRSTIKYSSSYISYVNSYWGIYLYFIHYKCGVAAVCMI